MRSDAGVTCYSVCKHYDAAQIFAGLKVGIAAVYFVEPIGSRHQFAQLQRAVAIISMRRARSASKTSSISS